MKNKYLLVLLAIFNLTGLAQSGTRKAVFVIADGIPADVIWKLELPHLQAIAKEGKLLHAHVGGSRGTYSQTPTISAVGYNSLLTGTWVNKHNVWDNDIAAPNYSYHSIFRLFKDQFPEKKTAIFSTWLDNRTKLVGEGLPQTGGVKVDYHYDGLELDTIKFRHDKESNYTHLIDEAVVDTAAECIRNKAPDLTWVYLEYTDDMGHRYGDSKKLYDAVAMMDGQVGRLWDAILYRTLNFHEDWVIYITTDHGRNAATGRNHGGQSDRERDTWIVTNEKKIDPWFLNHPPGIVDIMPSLAAHLGLAIPLDQAREIDGVDMTSRVVAADLQARVKDNHLILEWQSLNPSSRGKIWIAFTNQFKTGGTDDYRLMREVNIGDQKADIDLSSIPSRFYKIVLEAGNGYLNQWVILP